MVATAVSIVLAVATMFVTFVSMVATVVCVELTTESMVAAFVLMADRVFLINMLILHRVYLSNECSQFKTRNCHGKISGNALEDTL